MFEEFLTPFSVHAPSYSNLQIGNYIFQDLEKVQKNSIVLISCPNGKCEGENFYSTNNFIKEQLYLLASGNWKLPIFDAGEILQGHSEKDTQFAIQSILKYCLDKKAFPILLGGSMELLYSFYRSFNQEKVINITTIDSETSLEPYQAENAMDEKNYLFRIFNEEPNQLFHYSNLGYQSYNTSYKIIDTLQSLDFEALRLGDLLQNIAEVEPILRSTDVAAINLNSIQTNNQNFNTKPNPNGFSSREICSIARYIGISQQMKGLVIGNFLSDVMGAKLVAQIIWYCIEGLNTRLNYEATAKNFIKYTVLYDNSELIFLKDKIIDKWWMQLILDYSTQENKLIPCSYNDYLKAVSGELPERYLNAIKKFL